MENKSTFNKVRDALQMGIYKVINPFVYGKIKIGITHNMVTTIGFLGNLAAAVVFVYAAIAGNGSVDCSLVGIAGRVLILSSLFYMLDGQVARLGNMQSTFGAMYDSVLDRYSELVTLGGICYMLMEGGYFVGSVITFAALVGSLMVSYVRARAEGLGIECKVGLMQRPERVVVTCLGAIACGIYGSNAETPAFDPMLIVIVAMGLIALLANITAFVRIAHCRKQLENEK